MRRLISFTAASLLLAATAGTALADRTRTLASEYKVTLTGLTIGGGQFTTRIGPDGFAIEGKVFSDGLVNVFKELEAWVAAAGTIGPDGAQPHVFSNKFDYGDKSSMTRIGFSNGKAGQADVAPPPPPRRASWIEVEGDHLRNASDPLSAMLAVAASPAGVCNRTLKVYDGEIRADIVLSPREVRPDRVTCDARFTPVAGYHTDNGTMRWLSTKSRISFTFVPLGAANVYGVSEATIGTQIGTIRIRLDKIRAM